MMFNVNIEATPSPFRMLFPPMKSAKWDRLNEPITVLRLHLSSIGY